MNARQKLEEKLLEMWEFPKIKRTIKEPQAEKGQAAGPETKTRPKQSKSQDVLVVDYSQSDTKNVSKGKKDWKDFMSSNIKTVAGRKEAITQKDQEQDRLDDEHDRELMDLLKTTQLVKDYSTCFVLT